MGVWCVKVAVWGGMESCGRGAVCGGGCVGGGKCGDDCVNSVEGVAGAVTLAITRPISLYVSSHDLM